MERKITSVFLNGLRGSTGVSVRIVMPTTLEQAIKMATIAYREERNKMEASNRYRRDTVPSRVNELRGMPLTQRSNSVNRGQGRGRQNRCGFNRSSDRQDVERDGTSGLRLQPGEVGARGTRWGRGRSMDQRRSEQRNSGTSTGGGDDRPVSFSGAGRGRGRQCFRCRGIGHIARDCPSDLCEGELRGGSLTLNGIGRRQ